MDTWTFVLAGVERPDRDAVTHGIETQDAGLNAAGAGISEETPAPLASGGVASPATEPRSTVFLPALAVLNSSVRTLFALALLLPAAGCSDRRAESPAQSAPSSSSARGSDNVVVRIPRGGGLARAFQLARPDSAIWTAPGAVPGPAELIGFDQEDGSLAYRDTRGVARRLTLRLGDVGAAAPASAKLVSFVSADGASIYAVQPNGAVVRLRPTGEAWSFAPPLRVREIFPQDDGTIIVVARRGNASILWRLQPPADRVLDSALIPVGETAVRSQVGDRLYFGTDSSLVGVRIRTLDRVPEILLEAPPRVLASSPSGDRIFVAGEADSVLAVVDRYRNVIAERISLPGPARDLRMDPLGRYLLVRPERGDSTWVIAVGTSRVLGALRTKWLADLPLVTPEGSVLLADGDDVVSVDAETLRPRTRVTGGARDFWIVLVWNGFRPRAPGIDEPVAFAGVDSAAADSSDSLRVDSAVVDVAATADAPAPPAQPLGFIVSFASFPTEERARDVASGIHVGGESPRVVAALVGDTPVYRVVLGPFPSRAEAERAGRESGRTYWVFEGAP